MTPSNRRTVHPGPVSGTIAAPPSKSVLQRALAAASLAAGTSRLWLRGPLPDDAEAALRVIQALGAHVERHDDHLAVTGGGVPTSAALDCGEAGLSLRMFTALAALHDTELTLTARGSLAKRPIDMALAPLAALGVRCHATDGLPPVTVEGPLQGGRVVVDGRVSSQFLTGLLLALPCCDDPSDVIVRDLKSKPYVELTVALQRRFGVRVEPDAGMTRFDVPGRQRYRSQDLAVEGDWSGAAFPLVAAAVAGAVPGEVTLTGLAPASPQADRRILDALTRAGAHVTAKGRDVTVAHRGLRGFVFDATHAPDLFPPLVALALCCRGTSMFTGADRLRHKESDRATALREELGKLGAYVQVVGDRMIVVGSPLTGGEIDARGDHRIAMAAAVVALRATAPVTITGADSVTKSYPAFFEDLRALGARVG